MNRWKTKAVCADAPSEWFFPPPRMGRPSPKDWAKARAVCAVCPVVAECLEMAVADGLDKGFFGGTTPDERNPAMADRDTLNVGRYVPKPCGTPAAHKRHKRAGEEPCLSCVIANNKYVAARTAARKMVNA